MKRKKEGIERRQIENSPMIRVVGCFHYYFGEGMQRCNSRDEAVMINGSVKYRRSLHGDPFFCHPTIRHSYKKEDRQTEV